MAIKDLIGPGFVGTATIEFIVTRGLGAAASTGHLFFKNNKLIGDLHRDENFRKGVAVTGFTFVLIDKSDGSAITSGTVTVSITKDGGTQGSSTNSAVHEGNGQWSVNLTAAEMDADIVGIVVTHTDATPDFFVLETI